jgi:tetratricopeptide (TPR) repeat protein
MISRHAISFLIRMIILTCLFSGCVHDVPPAIAPDGATTCQTRVQTRKMQAKVGIYLNDDLRKYVYRRKTMGVTFMMNIGESLSPILTQMGSAITSKDVVMVDSLPPYSHDYRPDVDAVIEPEIVYCYGNVTGTVTGHIDAKVIMRMTVYDIDGDVLWQDEATGVNRSGELNLPGNYLGILENADKTGYGAVFSAASKLVDDLTAAHPGGLYTVDTFETPRAPVSESSVPDMELFEQYYRSGRFQYEKRHFCQALRSFEEASILNPGDLSTLFYLSACYTYTGNKNKALNGFRKFYALCQTNQEADDATKWITLLEVPLKIALVSPDGAHGMDREDLLIQRSLTDSGMYAIVKPGGMEGRPFSAMTPPEFDHFLDECHDKGIKIVLVGAVDYKVTKAVTEGPDDADAALDHIVTLSVRAYSTNKKELRTEITITEKASTIGETNMAEEAAIEKQLLERSGTRLVLKLLKNEIF